jgi:hypothetical protein
VALAWILPKRPLESQTWMRVMPVRNSLLARAQRVFLPGIRTMSA